MHNTHCSLVRPAIPRHHLPWLFNLLLVCAALVACLVMSMDVRAQGPRPESLRKGRILVAPTPGVPEKVLDKVLERAGAKAIERIPGINTRIVSVPENAERAVAAALSRRIEIDYAEPDMQVELSDIANDPYFGNAWHLHTMGLTNAWPLALGDGITIAILDSGIDPNHPDLAEKLVAGHNSASVNTTVSTSTIDINGHGTKVAGAAAAISNNGIGVTGIAWNTVIMPIRVTNSSDGVAWWSDIARGLIWAADHGARVANISYAVGGSSTVSSAAQHFRSLGGVVVNSAGNSGADTNEPPNPSLITVSATGSSDTRTSWSSFGNVVDLAAPGAGIYTTRNGGSYGTSSGTSFSSPLTAGVVALIMSAQPSMTPDEVESVLIASALDLGESGWDPYYGYGRVDAAAALEMAAGVEPGDSELPVVTLRSPTNGEEVSDLVPIQLDASDNVAVAYVELMVNGQLIATDAQVPYGFVWDSTAHANGAASLMLYAYDAAGNRGNSESVSVLITNASGDTGAPQVSISSPQDGATVSGSVNLSAFAQDDQGVAEVRLLVDGQLKCAGSPSVSCAWNTRKVSQGAHTITATARDVAGNTATTSINVTVGGSTKGGGGKGGGGGGKGRKK